MKHYQNMSGHQIYTLSTKSHHWKWKAIYFTEQAILIERSAHNIFNFNFDFSNGGCCRNKQLEGAFQHIFSYLGAFCNSCSVAQWFHLLEGWVFRQLGNSNLFFLAMSTTNIVSEIVFSASDCMRAPRYEDLGQYGYHSGAQLCGLSTEANLKYQGP